MREKSKFRVGLCVCAALQTQSRTPDLMFANKYPRVPEELSHSSAQKAQSAV